MASGSSRLSGLLSGTGRAALRMPPSMTKCATWIPLGESSRVMDCAKPRRANLPMAKVADNAKPFTPAVAPVRKIAPWACGSMQRAAHAGAGVVDHDVGRAPLGIESGKQVGNFLLIGGVAGMNLRAGLLREC